MNRESEIRLKMAKKLCENLKVRLKDNLISFVVFGSTARGKAKKKESDIDILLIVKEEKIARKVYLEEKIRLQKPYSPQFYSIIALEEKLRENPYILLDMIEDRIVLLDCNNIFEKLINSLKKKLEELGAKRVWIDEDTWYWDLKPDWKPGEVVEIKL